MDLKFIYPRWGSATQKWDIFLQKVKTAGYDGVEIDLPLNQAEKKEIIARLNDFELTFIGQHWQTKAVDFKEHINSFEKHLYNLAESNPLLINSHTGMDFFSFHQNAKLLELADKIAIETNTVITHETHRSRFYFAAHVCYEYLKEFPFLKLTSDFSHWCCVAESMLENQDKAVEKAIANTYHIHARVGSAQSPQIVDPRDTNYALELDKFKEWWKLMIINAKNSKRKNITITPEYGPFPYALRQINSDEALGNQWEINQFIKNEIALLK